MKRLEKKLEDLLLQKRFEELSIENQQWVLAQISVEEYRAMRQTLLESKRAFQTNQPRLDPNIQNRLRKRVLLNKQPNQTAKLFRYAIPAWQVVAAACVLFLLFVNFKSTILSPQKVDHFITDTVFKVDTVYKKVPAQFVDSTFETYPDTNAQVISNKIKRINQSPRQSYFKSKTLKKNHDTLQVSYPELNNTFTTTFDTAVLNSMINDYLQSPADKRRGSIDEAALDLIDRVY